MSVDQDKEDDDAHVEALSAITLATHDMARAVRFYEALGFRMLYGGANEAFTSFAIGSSFLNLTRETHDPIRFWGRVIIYVSDVDAFYRKAVAHGIEPQFGAVARALFPSHRSRRSRTELRPPALIRAR
jgi:catechol 2,3-dioxygenase-like lactoylglutathione lyase family enzyme